MSGGNVDHWVSSRAYYFYLKSQVEAANSDHRSSADDLAQAEVYDLESTHIPVALAGELERLGELSKAEAELRRAAQRAPKDALTQFALGRVLAEEKSPTKVVVSTLQRAIALNPRDVEAAATLASVFVEIHKEDQAIKVIEAQARLAPNEAGGYKSLGQAFAERGDGRRAEKMLRAAEARSPGDVETLLSLARLLEEQSRLREAQQAYQEALTSDPEEPNVLLALGTLALRTGEPAAAKGYFEQLLSVMPDDAEVKVKVAFAWFAARHVVEAAALLDEARKGTPGDARLAFYAGLIHEDARAFDSAAEAFGAVDHGSELYPEASLHLGNCLSLAGHHAEAIGALKGSMAEHPEATAYTVALAQAYSRAGQATDGISLLQQSADAQHDDDLYVALDELLERSGRGREGRAVLERALVARPNDVKLLYALGLTLSQEGELDPAVVTMKRVLAIEPENANALNFVAYLYADHGLNLDEADRLVRHALKLRPDSGAYSDTLGWVSLKRGDLHQAIEALERADLLAPNEPVIIEHLGDALVKVERHAEGMAAYRRALQALDAEPDETVRSEIERKLQVLTSSHQAGN